MPSFWKLSRWNLSSVICLVVLLGPAVSRLMADDIVDAKGVFAAKSIDFSKGPANRLDAGVSPDGLMRAESGFQKVKVWSIPDNQLLLEFATPDRSHAPTFTPDSSILVVEECNGNLGCAGTLRAWNLKARQKSELAKCTGVVTSMNFSADGTRLAVVTSYSSITAMMAPDRKKWLGGEVFVLDLKSGEKPFRLSWEAANIPVGVGSQELTTHYYESLKTHMPHQISLNHDGSKLMTVLKAGNVAVFDVQSGTQDFATDTTLLQRDETVAKDAGQKQ